MLFLKDKDRYIYGIIGYEEHKKDKVLYLDDVACMGEIINTTEREDIGLIVLYILKELGQYFEGDIIITESDNYWTEFIFKNKHIEKETKFRVYTSSSKEYILYYVGVPCFDENGGDDLIIKHGNLYDLKYFKKEIYDLEKWGIVKGWEVREEEKEECIKEKSKSPKMYYTVYEITDLTNGMKYIGKHMTDNLEDSYMGSGRLLKQNQEIKGIENFTKKILHLCKNEQHMNEMERLEIEKVKAYENNDYYNLM